MQRATAIGLTILASIGLFATSARASTASPLWSAYLDQAYVYSSADSKALKARLDAYGEEAGITLERYLSEYFETLAPLEAEPDEAFARRRAVAYFLDYLANGRANSLESAVNAINQLSTQLDRRENRYWYHYIMAHRALERGRPREFVSQLLQMWLGVVAPLEAPYEALDTLALSDTPNSGFVAALPYLYENVTRLILIRSQEAGMDRDLDPLGALIGMLDDARIGNYPDVIPPSASSRDYLERITTRLAGPESDDGSLTFTLTLFEAARHHEHARSMLAEHGLGDETLRAVRGASGAYETALSRAHTVQGRTAVYTRVLRQLGEIYAARQRLEADPELDLPFSVEGAIEVYAELRVGLKDGHEELGYRTVDRSAYLNAMRGLWEEIQETSLNAADFYMARAGTQPERAGEHARNAARVFTRYLSFFHQYATEDGVEGVPDSAYFAAFEAARGVGDAYLVFAPDPSPTEVELATKRYQSALALFPFDRELWPELTAALGRHGREGEFGALARPIAERVTRSRAVDNWVEDREENAAEIATLRRGFADSLVLMYLGFADAASISRLESEIGELDGQRTTVREERDQFVVVRDQLRGSDVPAAPDPTAGDTDTPPMLSLRDVAKRIADREDLLEKMDQQLTARNRALPLYRAASETTALGPALRTSRDHPMHVLLRRMYHERRTQTQPDEEGS